MLRHQSNRFDSFRERKMSLFAWVLRTFVEPFFWSALQWVWTFTPDPEPAELPLQFYSYSATSLLLWFYEKLPHSVVLFIFMIGCLTIGGLFIVLACGFGRVLVSVLKLIIKTFLIRVLRSCYYIAIRIISSSLIVIGLFCARTARVCRSLQSLCNNSQGTVADAPVPQVIDDTAVFRQLRDVEAIEAAAFRPRRRRARSSQSPRRAL